MRTEATVYYSGYDALGRVPSPEDLGEGQGEGLIKDVSRFRYA